MSTCQANPVQGRFRSAAGDALGMSSRIARHCSHCAVSCRIWSASARTAKRALQLLMMFYPISAKVHHALSIRRGPIRERYGSWNRLDGLARL